MYGRSATSMVGLYLLALVGVPLATFALFMLGYSIYAALRNHPYIAEPLYNLMCLVRDMAILFVILLLAGGCTPGEAAARLGFADSAYFSRCFKRAYGVTPRDFARHARKAAAAKAATNRYTTPPNVHVTKPDGEVE